MSARTFWTTLASIQLTSASLSFVASSAIAIMIARRPKGAGGLSSPYRRIIFGLSVSHILQSFALIVGPFAVPSSVRQALWGHGNHFTCVASGFLLKFSQPHLYTFSLCFYYLCRLWMNMTDKEFSRKIEWMMHSFIIVYGLSVATVAFATQSINSAASGTLCTTAPLPTGCRQNPEIFGVCDPVLERRTSQFLLLSSSTFIASLLGIMTSMGLICCVVIKAFRTPAAGTAARPPQQVVVSNILTSVSPEISQDQDLEGSIIATSAGSISNAERWGQLKKETCVQAISYIMAFLATYCPLLIYRFMFLDASQTPKILLLILYGLFPLSGFLNIFVFTQGATASLKRMHPTYSWPRVFILVIKAGGEVPTSSILPRVSTITSNPAGAQKRVVRHIPNISSQDPLEEPSGLISSIRGAMHGSSMSLRDDDVGFLSPGEWKYVDQSGNEKYKYPIPLPDNEK